MQSNSTPIEKGTQLAVYGCQVYLSIICCASLVDNWSYALASSLLSWSVKWWNRLFKGTRSLSTIHSIKEYVIRTKVSSKLVSKHYEFRSGPWVPNFGPRLGSGLIPTPDHLFWQSTVAPPTFHVSFHWWRPAAVRVGTSRRLCSARCLQVSL